LYLSITILFLFAAVLALFTAVFSIAFTGCAKRPSRCVIMIPLLWISLEFMRSFVFTGFPWELLGYSQFKRLYLIQASDMFGVYGVSFLIALCNTAILLGVLFFTQKKWQEQRVSKPVVAGAALAFAAGFALNWIYGAWRINTVDNLISTAPTARIAVVQGNIDQSVKWNPAFQTATVKTYNRLSLTLKAKHPDLIVWPESATPFYLLYDIPQTEMVFKAIKQTNTDFLIGSPSFTRNNDTVAYYNSAYLISPRSKNISKYDKAHLVPYGEYVPIKKWLPFLGKMVAQVGDFQPGNAGKTIPWKNGALGVQICYEVIFAELSRVMVKNGATLLINITNDAWFGKTSGPYQHFSMTIFRAVENRRALARSANTGISGFIDPVGRIMDSSALLEEAAICRTLPLIHNKTFYTRFGDFFAMACLAGTVFVILLEIVKYALNLKRR
jgi:apolipoprotein N-acyltransferase